MSVHDVPACGVCLWRYPPRQWRSMPQPDTMRHVKSPGALSGVLSLPVLRHVPQQLRGAGQLQDITGLEVSEQEPGKGMHKKVPKCIEDKIAFVVGDGQRVAVNSHEAGLAPAMADIGPTRVKLVIMAVMTGHEKSVDLLDKPAGLWIKRRQYFGLDWFGRRRLIGGRHVTCLNILRAVAERLHNLDFQTVLVVLPQDTVDTVAPACRQFYAKQTQSGAVDEIVQKRIARQRLGRDFEGAVIGR